MADVVIQECNAYEPGLLADKINAGVARLGGWGSFVRPGQTVLLKVNLIGPKGPESAAVTHCEFVRALVRLLQGQGCRVWIGDSAGGAIAGIAPTAQSLAASGLTAVAAAEGAEIKNFDREGVLAIIPESHPADTMYLARPYLEADVVISLPKLKTHSAGFYTGAVKNLFGCVPGLRKAQYHRLAPDPRDFGHFLVDIHRARPVALHIMDGVTAMEGEGPTAGAVYPAGKILISRDPLALDVVAIAMLGADVENIPILNAARARRLGEWRLAAINVSGDYTSPPRLRHFRLPQRYASSRQRNYGAVVRVIDFFKTRPRINPNTCRKCNLCVESCPVQAIDRETKRIDYAKCIECLCCHELCRFQAVELKRDNFLAGLAARLFSRGH